MHVHGTCMRVCDFAAETNVAEGNGEDAGGEGGVAKLLEQQTLEDKEREDGEEGTSSSLSLLPSLVLITNPELPPYFSFNRCGRGRELSREEQEEEEKEERM